MRKNNWVLEEMKVAFQYGETIRLEDNLYNYEDIRALDIIREDCSYMQEFVGDSAGKIVEVIFYPIND